jgi:hypothetical protein
MFEKWQSKTYPKADATELHKHAFQWWNGTGFRVNEVGPGAFTATSASRWGLERQAEVNVKDVKGTTEVEMRFRANVTTEGILGGGLALILVWPVAVIGGAYSVNQYEKEALDLMYSFWNSMGAVAGTAPVEEREEVIQTTAVSSEESGHVSPVMTGTFPDASKGPLPLEEKLDLLEDRLLRGEISEATYMEIKDRLGSK